MKTIVLLILVVSSAYALEPPATGRPTPLTTAGGSELVLTLNLPVQAGLLQPEGAVNRASAQLDILISHGWHVTQTTMLGRSADDKAITVLVVLDRTTGLHPGSGGHDGAPWAGTPVSPAVAGTHHIRWDDGAYSTVVISPGVGARSPAVITTMLRREPTPVTYAATAFIDANGALNIDARGAPVKDMESYSPDSFSIRLDGSVLMGDDRGNGGLGRITQDPPPPQEHPRQPRKSDQAL